MSSKFITTFMTLLAFLAIRCHNSGPHTFDDPYNSNNVFAPVNYDKVVAYDYNGEGDINIIDKEGNLAERIKSQKELTKSQIIRFTNTLCDRSTYGGDIAACFNPHLGIVFYKESK